MNFDSYTTHHSHSSSSPIFCHSFKHYNYNTFKSCLLKGMMDGAYFTSRKDILDFFNSLLSMNLAKIEQTATGAVACQLMDYMFPGSVPMKRVNWGARSEFQYIENYKLLQAAFTKQHVQKHVDVDRLIRAKYQDNLEFCQWLKAFFEHAASAMREDYDAVARRSMGKGGKSLDDIFLPRGLKNNGKSSSKGFRTSGSSSMNSSSRSVSSASRTASSASSRRSATGASSSSILKENNSRLGGGSVSTSNKVRKTSSQLKVELENEELMKKNSAMRRKNAEIEVMLENIENERDFYFDKLRGIEVMLQVHEEDKEQAMAEENEDGTEIKPKSDPEALIQRIFKVLYAKIEDKLVVTDDGEVSVLGIITHACLFFIF